MVCMLFFIINAGTPFVRISSIWLSVLKYGHFLKKINQAHLTLNPKKENRKEVSDYRPISQCNVSYKFISNLVANRLEGCFLE